MVDSIMSQLPQIITPLCFVADVKFFSNSKSKFTRHLGPAG